MNKKITIRISIFTVLLSGYLYLALTPNKMPPVPAYPKSVGLCIMATGKYVYFVEPLIRSADRFFLPGHLCTYFVFTDRINDLPKHPHIVPVYQKRLGWPYDSMMRMAVYLQHKELFNSMDYLFACDADMKFVDYVGGEILHDRVGTLHPGFVNKRGSYDQNPQSKAYVNPHEGTHYFAGGFYGGSHDNFINLLEAVSTNIQEDLSRNIVALWHDESHLNRYFIDHKPTCMLNTSYCYPEGLSLTTPPRLVALNKCKAYWRA